MSALRILTEFRMNDQKLDEFKIGQELKVDLFKECGRVDITGKSKGKGFAGVMKRHNMHGFHAGHGTHECFRHGGSLGAQRPQHVIKGTKMPGRLGNTNITTQNLEVVEIKSEQNLMLIKGAIPGPNRSYITIRPALKKAGKKKVA